MKSRDNLKRTRSEAARAKFGPVTLFGDQTYVELTRSTEIKPNVRRKCQSSSSREIIMFNAPSETLYLFFKDFLNYYGYLAKTVPLDEELQATLPWKEPDALQFREALQLNINAIDSTVLKNIVDFIKKQCQYTKNDDIQALVKQYCQETKTNYHTHVEVPLDYFLKHKKVTCRHQTLLAGYLLAMLQDYLRLTYSPGKIFRFRTELFYRNENKVSAHSVLIYKASNDDNFLLDVTAGLVINLASNSDIKRYTHRYRAIKADLFLNEVQENYLSDTLTSTQPTKKQKRF